VNAVDLDELLPAIGAGDATAFARFVAGAEPPLRAALRRFAAAVDTEAVLQETLLRVWQLAPKFAGDGRANALLRFSHRIAHNLAVSETRRRRATVEDLTADLSDPEPASPSDPFLARAIAECRERLPGKPAQALAARLLARGDEPDTVLATRLQMTLNTFLQNFTRARRLLAECLEGRGVEL
jgi:RNA polymerase sigma-70 factor (ECF subfamily)